MILVSLFFLALFASIGVDPEDTTDAATAVSYDFATGILTVYDQSGEEIASGDDVADLYADLHP